jgi:hypothetical protein
MSLVQECGVTTGDHPIHDAPDTSKSNLKRQGKCILKWHCWSLCHLSKKIVFNEDIFFTGDYSVHNVDVTCKQDFEKKCLLK